MDVELVSTTARVGCVIGEDDGETESSTVSTCAVSRARAGATTAGVCDSSGVGVGSVIDTGCNISGGVLGTGTEGETMSISSVELVVAVEIGDSMQEGRLSLMVKGNVSSQNTTSRDMNVTSSSRSYSFHPFFPEGYPRKMHLLLREANLSPL